MSRGRGRGQRWRGGRNGGRRGGRSRGYRGQYSGRGNHNTSRTNVKDEKDYVEIVHDDADDYSTPSNRNRPSSNKGPVKKHIQEHDFSLDSDTEVEETIKKKQEEVRKLKKILLKKPNIEENSTLELWKTVIKTFKNKV